MEMETQFNPTLVVLSVFVAIFASFVALNIAHSVTHAVGRARTLWLMSGATAMGIGIWSMHFVGMLAFEMPGMSMAYDIPLMILSIIVAVGASALALYIVSQPVVPAASVVSGSIAMAVGIAGMHYIGMYSMRMDAEIVWNIPLVILSVAIALGASLAALKILIILRDKSERLVPVFAASTVMGFAIAGMHYTGMVAAKFVHIEKPDFAENDILVTSGLTATVLVMTLLILGLALASSIGHRFVAQMQERADQVIVRNEERYRRLIEAVKDYAIFMLDPDGLVASWNSGAQKITGYSAFEIIGRHFSVFYTQEDLDIDFPRKELEIAKSRGHYETERQRVRKNGTTFWANVMIAPVYDSMGVLTGFSKVTRDVTALKEAESRMLRLNEDLEKRVLNRTMALQEREAQLRSITNALPVLVGQVSRDEKILFANEMFCDWFGVKQEDVIGMSMREVFGEERYLANKPYIDRALTGEVTIYERHSTSGSRQMVLSITFVPEVEGRGHVAAFNFVATDISKHKEIEAELKKARDAAEVANKTKSAFLANMSHEIRTPLGAVLGFSELILDQEMSEEERQNSIEVIKRNGKLLSNIINDILDLSKVEAGKLEIEKVDVPLSEVMEDMGTLQNLEALEKGIVLTVSAEGSLPKTIKTDPLRLRQILLNIIGNAVKFTEHGRVDIAVKAIASSTGDPKLAFVVRDTGEGILPEQAAKLFTPFTQADVSTTRRFGGTGLGLVLSKKLANALGGDIVLQESRLAQGSTFVVTIDPGVSTDAVSVRRPAPGAAKTAGSSPANLKHLKVLVVDDSPENQVLIKVFLNAAGAFVETANNGREGVEKALGAEYDLVLMDLQMPEMDGYQATDELRKKSYRKPIIALTAHAMKEDRRRCLESGFDDHMTKPIDRKLLLAALAEY